MFSESVFPAVTIARSTSVLGGVAILAHAMAVAFALLGLSAAIQLVSAYRSGKRADAGFFAFWTALHTAAAAGVLH